MKTDKQKRKADEANLGSEPPSEDLRRRKRKRPLREKRKDNADKVTEGLEGHNGNKISQVAETTREDGDLNVSNTKSGKDKVTGSALEDIQEQEKAELKAIAKASGQPKERTKKRKEGGDGDIHGKARRKLVGKDKPVPEAEQSHVFSENPDVSDKKQSKNKKRKRDSKDDTLQLEKDRQSRDRTLKSAFPDPAEDESLSEPAIKALSYVYARTVSNPEWKFNKARQNWIIRHLWDNQTIPEKYFASCLKYLEGIQGNTRDVISKSALSLIGGGSNKDSQSSTTDRTKTAETPSGNTTVTIEDPTEKATLAQVERAREVLACLGCKKSG